VELRERLHVEAAELYQAGYTADELRLLGYRANELKALNIFDSITLNYDITLKNDTNFWLKNGDFINNNRRGYGYWLWKSYVMLKEFNKMKDNDILIYLDAGCYINPKGYERFKEYIEILKNSNYACISFQMSHHIEKKWTTKEIFQHFNINCETGVSNDILETGQINATVKMFKKNAN
jgi:hypothetical protein